MEKLPKCSACNQKAIYICSCSALNLCETHAKDHYFSQHTRYRVFPELIEIAFKLSEQDKKKLEYELKFRKDAALKFKKHLLQETFSLINKIFLLMQNAVKKLDDKIAEYNELKRQKYFHKNNKQIIDRLLNTSVCSVRKVKALSVHKVWQIFTMKIYWLRQDS